MPDDRSTSETIPLAIWLKELGGLLGPSGGPGPTDEEQTALLDIARTAAHTSERISALLSTYIAGLACASLSPAERGVALRSLADQLEEKGRTAE